jgi:hypothetical protein
MIPLTAYLPKTMSLSVYAKKVSIGYKPLKPPVKIIYSALKKIFIWVNVNKNPNLIYHFISTIEPFKRCYVRF